MIKAVFLDWFNTLAHYDPPREELQSQALRESGIQISPQKLTAPLLAADKYWFEENARQPVRNRSVEEQSQVYLQHQQIILRETGVNMPSTPDLLKLLKRVRELAGGLKFKLFDDVLPTLDFLKRKGLILGLLTNLDRDMKPIARELGLESLLDFIVTSGETGADKPNPKIFLAALQKAGVKADEAVHVGDQYKIDVQGARGVGIKPILLDRYNQYPEITDCPRISRLTELNDHL